MRILKPGVVKSDEKKMTCSGCGCVFIYSPKDIVHSDIPGIASHVPCPQKGCKRHHVV